MKTRQWICTAALALICVGHATAFYNPQVGRFASRDPIWERGGINLYGFVANNPIAKHDYLGLVGMGNLHLIECGRCYCGTADRWFFPGGANFQLTWIAAPNGYRRLGDDIFYVWTVVGDPEKCSYSTDETGSSVSLYFKAGGVWQPVIGRVGVVNPWAPPHPPTFSPGLAYITDFIGFGFPPSATPGEYAVRGVLKATTRCTDSFGRVTSHTFPDINIDEIVAFPP